MPTQRLSQFDTWRAGYGGAIVSVYVAGTSTLANLFLDEDLTEVASNPQTLLTKTENNISYGKWPLTIYTNQTVTLDIDSQDQTGIIRPPISTLAGQNASTATVTPAGGSQAIELEDALARVINVRDYGQFLEVGESGASASTNTNTLTAAIGRASALGGGVVRLPAGTFTITAISISENVVVTGADRAATILQSTEARDIVTINGDNCGLAELTVDGVSLTALSRGVYSVGRTGTIFRRVTVKRFETGIFFRGNTDSRWIDVILDNCATGGHLRGDLDTGNASTGTAFNFNTLQGWIVKLCTTAGLIFERIDEKCINNDMKNIAFRSNTGTALKIIGARFTRLKNAAFSNNTVNIDVNDGNPVDDDNSVIDFMVDGGDLSAGTIQLTGNLENVSFNRVNFSDVDITITTPSNNVVAENCIEDSLVTIAGVATRWLRKRSIDIGASFGLTTGAAATKAWSIELDPGQMVALSGTVVGRQRNGANNGFYFMVVSAKRPPAQLNYETQTANFTLGDILTGGTSGATGRIVADSDSGTTGTLDLQDVKGAFVDNEIITDAAGGSAMANGTLSFSNAVLVGSVENVRAVQETDVNWAATFVANGPEIELQVTGVANQTIEWRADVEVVSS